MTKLLKKSSKRAFTMAEILLSLTIIGVVAAITLPSLTGNINERTWNTQRKALYARMSQAMALMPALNGLGTYNVETDSAGSTTVTDTAAQAFVTELGNVLKINNVCDNAHLEDCGIVSTLNNATGSEVNIPQTLHNLNTIFSAYPNTNAVAFETQNGESIVAYYNRDCKTRFLNEANSGSSEWGNISDITCVNFIYDLNSKKGPNTFGKDIGTITVLNAADSTVVAPMPLNQWVTETKTWEDASTACTTLDSDSRLPNLDELTGLVINQNITLGSHVSGATDFWSSTVSATIGEAWTVNTGASVRHSEPKSSPYSVVCVKR